MRGGCITILTFYVTYFLFYFCLYILYNFLYVSNGMEKTESLKLVKRATLENEDGIFVVRHYETKIFEYNPKNKEAWALFDCSVTSNKQIGYALDFFTPIHVLDERNNEKWGFST